MPIIKSAKKRLRQNIKKREANAQEKSKLRTAVKKVRQLAESGDMDQARTAYRKASSLLDKAVKKNLIHKNTAGRNKSKLAKVVS